MKQLIDFIPLIIFFTFFKLYGIFVGVTALMISSTLALILIWYLYRKIDKVGLFTYAMVMGFGALTLFFHNDNFIKWKVTIIYFIFAGVLFFSQYVMRKPLIQTLLGKEMKLPEAIWQRLNLAWAMFFLVCGLINIYISYQLSMAAWVNYKTFILPATTVVFTLISIGAVYRHIMPKTEEEELADAQPETKLQSSKEELAKTQPEAETTPSEQDKAQ